MYCYFEQIKCWTRRGGGGGGAGGGGGGGVFKPRHYCNFKIVLCYSLQQWRLNSKLLNINGGGGGGGSLT